MDRVPLLIDETPIRLLAYRSVSDGNVAVSSRNKVGRVLAVEAVMGTIVHERIYILP